MERVMNAEKARAIADGKKTDTYTHHPLHRMQSEIEDEARRGKYFIRVPPISDSLFIKLVALGFTVRTNRKRYTKISW